MKYKKMKIMRVHNGGPGPNFNGPGQAGPEKTNIERAGPGLKFRPVLCSSADHR